MIKGTIVMLKSPILENPIGTLGVCYDEYTIGNRGGSSFIFQNGEYDGFSDDEQTEFLSEVGFNTILATYEFTSILRLSNDINRIHLLALDPDYDTRKLYERNFKINSIILD